MPVMAEVTTVSPNAAEIAWKFVPDMSSLAGKGCVVIQISESSSTLPVEGATCDGAIIHTNLADTPPCSGLASSFCVLAHESPFWIDGLMPSTRYCVRVGGMHAPTMCRSSVPKFVLLDEKHVDVESSSVWAWSSSIQFVTPSSSEYTFLLLHFAY
jgi:hypothetical protein